MTASPNRSWNCGAEGPTDDENVLVLRACQQRNFLATLILSQGVPMMLHGDELGRTQEGNNNGYCQDSGLTWIHWESMDEPLTEFVAAVARLRRDHATFRRSRFFEGRPVKRTEGQPLPDIVWLNTDASVMVPEDWNNTLARALGVFYNGAGIGRDNRSRAVTDVNFLLCFNSGDGTVCFALPSDEDASRWEQVLDTTGEHAGTALLGAGGMIDVAGKSVLVLRAYAPPGKEVDRSVAASLALLAATNGPAKPARSRRPEAMASLARFRPALLLRSTLPVRGLSWPEPGRSRESPGSSGPEIRGSGCRTVQTTEEPTGATPVHTPVSAALRWALLAIFLADGLRMGPLSAGCARRWLA